ncbi:MAG: hypothetical protein IPL62_15400 [Caulobacteraceae bacterium]|nr:hypothetical protein [Caulobacteraceae bacterium]
MLFFALLAIQTATALAAGVWFWRRLERQQAEIADLREALAEKSVKRAKVASARGATAEVIPLVAEAEAAPSERAQRAWNLPATPTFTVPTAGISVETARGLTLRHSCYRTGAWFCLQRQRCDDRRVWPRDRRRHDGDCASADVARCGVGRLCDFRRVGADRFCDWLRCC